MGIFLTAKSILLYVISTFVIGEPTVDETQAYCLALNIYHEARSEPISGQVQVAHATLARVPDSRFPNSICGVVLAANLDVQGNPILYRCAFSWFCDGKPDDITFVDDKGRVKTIERSNFAIASLVAVKVMLNEYTDKCDGANFYYNPKLASPVWANIYTHKCEIGDHVFLKREKGSLL
jgi:spore germination cell wall hydrolase CwlJ-like protein